MKAIIIKLEEEDLGNEKYILEKIGRMIEDGYTSGMGSPVNWHLENNLENYRYGED